MSLRVCMRVEDQEDPHPDSLEASCKDCEQPVWYDPDPRLPDAEAYVCRPCHRRGVEEGTYPAAMVPSRALARAMEAYRDRQDRRAS